MNLKNQTLKFALLCFFACGLIPATFSQTTTNQTITSFNKASFRFIGPAYAGGRISDIEVFPQQTDHILISAASGGIFKSTDGKKTWIPVFDQAGNSLAIGDMDIADSNPAIVWAGTGEASGEQSAASIGDGVYKSLDAGLSWTKMGLQHTRHISRICIAPNDPETAYVAATGSRWGESEDRGVFKTTDGGNSWKKILFVNSNTGFGDLTLHPNGKLVELPCGWLHRIPIEFMPAWNQILVVCTSLMMPEKHGNWSMKNYLPLIGTAEFVATPSIQITFSSWERMSQKAPMAANRSAG